MSKTTLDSRYQLTIASILKYAAKINQNLTKFNFNRLMIILSAYYIVKNEIELQNSYENQQPPFVRRIFRAFNIVTWFSLLLGILFKDSSLLYFCITIKFAYMTMYIVYYLKKDSSMINKNYFLTFPLISLATTCCSLEFIEKCNKF